MATSEEAHRLNQQIKSAAQAAGMTPERLRKRIAFQRMLARFALDPAWVLKGGFSLEMRLGLVARATKDLDLWRLSPPVANPFDLQDLVDAALETDLHDGFTFRVGKPRHMDIADAEPATWRVGIETLYFGSPFVFASLDVVTTAEDVTAQTDVVRIEPVLVGDPFNVPAVDLNRHGAEKYHAMVRIYANDRPSTRVKDLVDVVLLIEGGWLTPPRLATALRRVFAERNNMAPPAMMPERPPADWAASYARLASDTGAGVADVRQAWQMAATFYAQALGQSDDV